MWKFGKCNECGLGEGYGKLGIDGGNKNPALRRTCPTCTFSWRDKYRKDMCPKCSASLSIPDMQKYKSNPFDALESQSGECPRGGAHSWKFGKCRNCGTGQGYADLESAGGDKNGDLRKRCPTCSFSWIDKYRKNECPKCINPLMSPPKRVAGEVSTWKKKPSDAMESTSGECSRGDSHHWRYGRCAKCGVGEGYVALRSNGGNSNAEVRRACPTCSYTWLDKYRRNECPKCLFQLERIFTVRPSTSPAYW